MLKYDPVGTSGILLSDAGLGNLLGQPAVEGISRADFGHASAAELAVVQSFKTSGITRQMQFENYRLT